MYLCNYSTKLTWNNSINHQSMKIYFTFFHKSLSCIHLCALLLSRIKQEGEKNPVSDFDTKKIWNKRKKDFAKKRKKRFWLEIRGTWKRREGYRRDLIYISFRLFSWNTQKKRMKRKKKIKIFFLLNLILLVPHIQIKD